MVRAEILETKKTYDLIAQGYSASVDRTLAGSVGEFEHGLLDYFIGMLPGLIVLDLGCGNGKDAAYLSSKKISAIGADYSRGMLGVAKEKHENVSFVQMDMRRLGVKSGRISGVWANGCVYHVPKTDFAEVLLEIEKALGGDGIFSFNFKIGEGEGLEERPRSFGGGSRYYAYYKVPEMIGMLEDSGLELVILRAYPEKIFGETIVHFYARKP
ncbi:MAG TPA: class I SAM-dependent methyltransferase [Candidatus Paceibacterota bacterium]|nr:class I SAM-dependent methyltransferase [Candidatus Pacearchaeota archaeon]HRZ51059.1 class I SAM-dependent methyltransferase [Candidatus Paceibacterota bacterium]HSA36782.1 class I SAM-dependent methyltransferase [Candidatus Paceibacterota bacterium]